MLRFIFDLLYTISTRNTIHRGKKRSILERYVVYMLDSRAFYGKIHNC